MDQTHVGLPRLNEAAPDFDADTTSGRRTLADYQGKWLLLFSHPADFTPVCTTEFMAFARLNDAQYPCKDFYYCTKAL
ncbi:redoxin domain-containing protein [Litorivicinus lipolyticus]|uniref:redoxin domain-containing protein n=1 Tax=Litorivicinus lipolyticus TaxID=418701 RepID=UPI001B8760AA|nr:redoxin domain-containing protein [Litorivicinus lipolyticus]